MYCSWKLALEIERYDGDAYCASSNALVAGQREGDRHITWSFILEC